MKFLLILTLFYVFTTCYMKKDYTMVDTLSTNTEPAVSNKVLRSIDSSANSMTVKKNEIDGKNNNRDKNINKKSLKLNKNINETFYIKSAFRVSDNVIRLSLIKSIYNNDLLLWWSNGKYGGVVKFECQETKCPAKYVPKCTFVGYIGVVNVPSHIKIDKRIQVQSKKTRKWISIPLIDVRKPKNFNNTYQHKLGVCIQPMFLYYNYLELIAFLEHWAAHGATKFYFYKNTFSHNVGKVLKHYKDNVKSIDIEIIDWSTLPFNGTDQFSNPNYFIYRLEPYVAVMDCMYRARYHVKYVAQVDIDELIITNSKYNNLLDYLEKKSSKAPQAISSFQFMSQFVKFPNDWKSLDDAKNVKFNHVNKVKTGMLFSRPTYSKLVFLPEANFNYYIHYALKTETGKLTNKTYVNYNVPSSESRIYHHRKIESKDTSNKMNSESSLMSREINTINNNMNKHIKLLNFEDDINNSTIKDAIHAFGICRENRKNDRSKMCTSLYTCEDQISDTVWKVFEKAKNSWKII
uniref:Glycosyltransferase family 92 protein n=1 Tax=Strongyloides venezuelensis TaxID=75913 RepID=A0A0K0G261_STRVS